MTKKHPFLSAKSAKALREAAIASAPALCKSLAGVAAFHVEAPAAQKKIFAAVKSLQVLAGLPPMPPCNHQPVEVHKPGCRCALCRQANALERAALSRQPKK